MYRGELFNSITHLVGTVMAIVGTTVLITAATLHGAGPRRIVALSVYGAMMVVLYLSSTRDRRLSPSDRRLNPTGRRLSSTPRKFRHGRWVEARRKRRAPENCRHVAREGSRLRAQSTSPTDT
jgi:hypothetical protein